MAWHNDICDSQLNRTLIFRLLVLSSQITACIGCGWFINGVPAKPGDRFEAAAVGDLKALAHFLRVDPEVDRKDAVGRTALAIAAAGNQCEIIEYLLKRGANVNSENVGEGTPLHAAAGSNAVEAGKLLLSAGANINARADKQGASNTPIDCASSEGQDEFLEFLIERGAVVDDSQAQDALAQSPLHWACMLESWKKMKPGNEGNRRVIAILAKHVDVNARNKQFRTPLHVAVWWGRVEVVRALLETQPKVDVNAQDRRGNTPLHFAVSPNYCDGDMEAAGDFVELKDRIEVVKLLLRHGARKDIRNFLAEEPNELAPTPLDVARERGKKELVKLLE